MSISKEAIEAGARALFAVENCDRRQMLDVESNWHGRLNDENRQEYRVLATAALTSAAPYIQAAAIADALEKLAVKFEATASCASYIGTEDIMETWLNAAQRSRKAIIEGEKP